MHYGSESGSGTGFGSGSDIKGNKKVKKILNERQAYFLRNKLLLTLKRQDFVKFVGFWKTAKYCLDPEPEPQPVPKPKTFPKPEPELQLQLIIRFLQH